MSGTGLDRRLLLVPVLLLVLAAVLGYVAGHRHARAAPREPLLTASVGGVLLNAPAHWRPAASAPEIPGLAVRHPVAFAPEGNPSQAGLLAGTLPPGHASPLPSQLLARLRQRPTTAIVSLQEAQAYRYTALSIPGYERSVTLFVVPNPGGDATALACFATPAQSAQLEACQRSVATLTLAGRSQTYDLTPRPEYAQRLGASITALNAQRASLRAQMTSGASPRSVQRAAAQLESAFAHTAASLSELEPSLATGPAQAALSGAVLRARAAYAALASAAGARDEGLFASARGQVERAEAGVDRALEGFTLLGYRAG